jgi:hypothetical protein
LLDARILGIVLLSVVQRPRTIADGKVKMTLGDLDKLIRLETFLRDEPDSRQEVVFADLKNKSTEELRELVRKEAETLSELQRPARWTDGVQNKES